MEETSYLTDKPILTGSGGIATTIGNNLSGIGHRARQMISQPSIIYNDRPGNHIVPAFGETIMPQVSQFTEEKYNYGR